MFLRLKFRLVPHHFRAVNTRLLRLIASFAACAASISAAFSMLPAAHDVPRASEQSRSELPTASVQDTTKKNPPSNPDVRTFNQDKTHSALHVRRPVSPFTLHVGELEIRKLTLEDADSLGNLHPEVRDFLLKQLTIQGGLAIDNAEFEKRKMLSGMFKDLRLYSELEAEMRRNQARYGTINNPLRPPPMPNQINLLDVLPAISNLLRALGLK